MILFILAASITAVNAQIKCHAPLGEYGPACIWPTAIAGKPFWYLNYHIKPEILGAELVCKAIGLSKYAKGQKCEWKMYSFDPVDKEDYRTVTWGSANSQPYIRCKAMKFDTLYTLNISTGNGDIECSMSSSSKQTKTVSN